MTPPLAVLIVEDLAPVRRGLRKTVERVFPNFTVYEAPDLRTARQHLTEQVTFHLALVDLGLPDGSGVELLSDLRTGSPNTLAIVTTIFDDDEHLFSALAAGANGYLLKEQPATVIEAHLRRLEEGTPALSPSIARRMLEHFRQATDPNSEAHAARLTGRETEVLGLIARGMRRGEVAGLLTISENTVAHYIKDIYRKLGVSSRAEAALEAARRGLV